MTVTGVRSNVQERLASRMCERIASALERDFWKWAAVFLVFWLICWMVQDLQLKMWNDEIFTLYAAQQGSPAAIIRGIRDGMDATPPLYPTIVSAILPFVRPVALAVRLPSTLGFTAMLLCILAFCHRRMPAPYAFIAASLAIMSCAFYATEGRSYGLVLGCAAGALFCWAAAESGRRRILWLAAFGFCLGCATALHYYSVFLLLPLGVGELMRWRTEKKPDIAMLAAMLPAVAVLALHYPLIEAGKRYLVHFWRPGLASWRQIPDFYLQFGLAPVAVIIVGLIVLALRRADTDGDSRIQTLPTHEWAALATLSLAPVFVVAIALCTTHVFLARYTLWAVIGLAILSAAVLRVCSRWAPLVGSAVVVILLSIVVVQQIRIVREKPVLRQGNAIFHELQGLPSGHEPILVAYSHAFIEMSYYIGPPLRDRLVYALDRAAELRYRGSDLDYLLLSGMRAHSDLRIVDLETFLKTNSDFMLAARPQDYLPQQLIESGYLLTPLISNSDAVIYKVQAHH